MARFGMTSEKVYRRRCIYSRHAVKLLTSKLECKSEYGYPKLVSRNLRAHIGKGPDAGQGSLGI